jgi:hypothetical protein
MKHNEYSYNVDVFNTNTTVNDKDDLWSANCAVQEILFSNSEKFENYFNYFKIIKNTLREFSIFPASGGVIAKASVPWLPKIILKALNIFDSVLIFFLPSVFALVRRVVLSKK